MQHGHKTRTNHASTVASHPHVVSMTLFGKEPKCELESWLSHINKLLSNALNVLWALRARDCRHAGVNQTSIFSYSILPFFLVSYEILGLCGHPVIEKGQKIHDIIFPFFG